VAVFLGEQEFLVNKKSVRCELYWRGPTMEILKNPMLSASAMQLAAKRIIGLMRYNKDWLPYLLGRSAMNARPETFRLRSGQVVTVHHDARWVLNEIYRDRVYDVPGVNLSACRTVLDVGANVGVFALFAASVGPVATVHCFEPDAANFRMLRRNLEANPGVRIFAHRAAVGENDGFGYLSDGRTSVTHTLAKMGGQRVELVSLGRAVEICGGDVDFLKMDVEGAEREILLGCPDTVLRRVRTISMEWHYPVADAEILAKRLRGLGFATSCTERDGVQYVKASRSD
jgi:FkbM family methyltransferase